MKRLVIGLGMAMALAWAAPPPDLPGVEIHETELALPKSREQVHEIDTLAARTSDTWLAPSIEEQLSRDRTLIGMGMGAMFIPAMTESRLEPEVLVTDLSGDKDWTMAPGQRIVLPQGTYVARIGSGSFGQKQVYKVVVEEGHTTILEPSWAGMVVETRNEDGDWVDETYDVFRMDSEELFGKGYGQTQERLKDIRTWILPPGLYVLVRSGEDLGSPRNYVTVQLNPGQLAQVELVFESSTSNLVAGGVRGVRFKGGTNSPWSYGMRVAGSVLYSQVASSHGKESDAWNVLADLKLRARYDRDAYFGVTELGVRNSFQWADDEAGEKQLGVLSDNIQFQTSWVRRIREWFGPYARGVLKSHLIKAEYFDPDYDLVILNSAGDTARVIPPGERFRVRPSLFPARIGEGLGVNLELPSTHFWELSMQSGIAWRQAFYRHVLLPQDRDAMVWGPQENERSFGLEGTLVGRVRLGHSVTADLQAEVFFPEAKLKDFQVESGSLELRFSLIRNVELAIVEELLDRGAVQEEVVAGASRFAVRSGVQMRLSINY